jgi:protoporphyrinogen/coproporphyrinogen III oxidase
MIAIVGGGLTGLALAHELDRRGRDHVVLEAADRPGGVIRAERVEGHLLEWGPQRGRLTVGMKTLVDELGLTDDLVLSPPGLPLYVYRKGRLRTVPFSPAAFLTSDIFSLAGKARFLLEPFTSGPRPGERVADFFTRKLGREAYENLLGPLYGGLYASDPHDMVVDYSLGHVLREFGITRSLLLPLLRQGGAIDPPAACSFREGLAMLPKALYERHRERVRLGTPVRSIRRNGAGYEVAVDGETLSAEQVVVTSPAPVAAHLLESVAPEASAAAAALNYNPLGVVHLYAPDSGLRGLGYQVSLAEKLLTRGVTFNDSLFGRTGVFTVYVGGAKNPQVVERSDEELAEVAVREFRQATGCEARPLSVERERMPAWDVSWRAMQGLRTPEGIHIAANWESRPGMPGRLHQAQRLAARLSGEPVAARG